MGKDLKYRYKYVGPVMEFDRLICSKWQGETVANSKEKAKSNLSYQFKINNNRSKTARISLPGKLLQLETIMD